MSKKYIERDHTTVYQLHGITYLPHYIEKNVYVSPGYGAENHNEYSANELVNAGAVAKVQYLIIRRWCQEKQNGY